MKLNGGCSCGKVRYQVESNLTSRCFCHCHSCRRASGAPYVAWGTSKAEDFGIVQGELAYYASSPNVRRGFCKACGTSLTYARQDEPSSLDIALATLDVPNALRPEFHIWLADKLEWVVIDDGLPCYTEWRTTD